MGEPWCAPCRASKHTDCTGDYCTCPCPWPDADDAVAKAVVERALDVRAEVLAMKGRPWAAGESAILDQVGALAEAAAQLAESVAQLARARRGWPMKLVWVARRTPKGDGLVCLISYFHDGDAVTACGDEYNAWGSDHGNVMQVLDDEPITCEACARIQPTRK